MTSIAKCIGCGCDDNHACVDTIGTACHWLRVDRDKGIGVCSSCGEHLPTFSGANPCTINAPLISSQRYLDQTKVADKATRFKIFTVYVYPVTLRGKLYILLVDGHHNLAAANLAGAKPEFKMPPKKFMRIVNEMTQEEKERHFINNLTDCDYYYVKTGEVVEELLKPQWRH